MDIFSIKENKDFDIQDSVTTPWYDRPINKNTLSKIQKHAKITMEELKKHLNTVQEKFPNISRNIIISNLYDEYVKKDTNYREIEFIKDKPDLIKNRVDWVISKITNRSLMDIVILSILIINARSDILEFDTVETYIAFGYVCFVGQQILEILLTCPNHLSDVELKNYIIQKVTSDNDKWYHGDPKYIEIEYDDFVKHLPELEGVFLCSSDGHESHNFTLYLTQDTITILNSYGGILGFFVTQYNKIEWIQTFIKLFGETEFSSKVPYPNAHEAYAYIWGLPVEHIIRSIGRHNNSISFGMESIIKLY